MSVLTVEQKLNARDAVALAVDVPRHPDEGELRLADVAAAALRRVLDVHGYPDVGARASVVRQGRYLRVRLCPEVVVPHRVLAMASVRAAVAVRAIDPDTPAIGVGAD